MDKEAHIQQLQLLEQSIQQLTQQKQRFQLILTEVDSALEEIGDKKEAYKIVGSIMVKKSTKELKEELEDKKKLSKIRIENLEKQETKLKGKIQKLQEEVMKKMKKE